MAEIHRVLLVHFAQIPVAIEQFLVEPDRRFLCVDLLDVSCQPAGSAFHFIRVYSSAIGQIAPRSEFAFIVTAFCGVHRGSLRVTLVVRMDDDAIVVVDFQQPEF